MSKKYGYIARIGVDTTGIVSALDAVDKNTAKAKANLNAINESLKFDSKNPELLAQKYDLISEQVENASKKLEALRSVQSDVEKAFEGGKITANQYEKYTDEVAKAESQLKLFSAQIKGVETQLQASKTVLDDTAYATKGLGDTLETLDANEKELNATIKEINAALSSGAGADVLTDKHHILAQAIENTRQRLEALKSAEKNMAEGVSNGNVSVEEQKKYQNEIQRTELKLKQYEGQLEQTRKKLYDNATATDKADEETKQFEVTLKEAGKSALSFGDVFKANVFSDFVVNGIRRAKDEIVDFAKESIETASDLAEVQNVVDVTFGDNAQSINTWSKEAASAFGMSELAAKQYAGTMGAMLKSSGIAEGSVTDLSKSIVQLAGDMASFYNLDISASFDKIRAGIAGETEPLRQLGINMTVANLEAYALSQGIETAWKNMSQSEQVMLRYNYLMAQTADAQGDFARTSDSLANQQRIAKLNMEQIQATLGEKLIPLVGELTGELNDNMPSIGKDIEQVGDKVVELTRFILDNKEAVIGAVTAFATYKATIAGANVVSSGITAFRSLTTAIKGATSAQEIFNIVTKENPYVLIASVAALTAGLIAFASTADTAANRLRDINKEVETLNKNTEDSIKKTEGDIAVLKAKAEEYENLRNEQKLTEGQEKRLADLAEDLQQYMPEGTKLIDEQTGAYIGLADSIDKATEAMRLNAKMSAYQEEYEGLIKKQIEAEKEFENIKKAAEENGVDIENFGTSKYGGNAKIGANMFLNSIAAEYNNAKSTLDTINKEIGEVESKIADIYEETALGTESAPPADYSEMAEYYENQGKAVLEDIESFEKDLEAGLSDIEQQYKMHKITDSTGEKDEAAYYERRREYLQQHCNGMSEIWWKYWDEVADYQKKQQEKQQTESEKAAKDAQTQKDDALKDGLDAIQTEYESTSVPEEQALKAEGDYLLKRRQYLQEHCDEASDVWKKYWADQLKDEKKYRDKLSNADKDAAKEEAEAWEKAFDDLAEQQKKAYDELTKQKEKAYEDLSGIDLTSTVTGADGKEKTILTDLNAATKKLTEYQNSLARLKNTGISDDLLNEILAMDYESGARQSMINTLLGLSADKRKLYYDDYEKYNAKAKEVAQKQVQDEVDELNTQTAAAVDNAFSSVTNSAYIAGADTAKSFLKGISENMSSLLTAMSGTTDLDTIRALLNIDSNMFAGSAKGTASADGGFYNTPITINLNDKQYINTTLGDLMEQGRLTGGNTFNL